MDGGMGGWMDGWIDTRMDGGIGGWMDGWVDEWMKGKGCGSFSKIVSCGRFWCPVRAGLTFACQSIKQAEVAEAVLGHRQHPVLSP